jgi:hypothetical protein
MDKIDFKKTLGDLYSPKNREWALVDVSTMQFLMIDGAGDPNTSVAYRDAVEALYAVAFALKFMSKKELAKEYAVPPLEGLWKADDMTVFARSEKDKYRWTMMIMQPAWITAKMYETALDVVRTNKKLPGLSRMRLSAYDEGLSLQLLHIGSYDDEAPVLAHLHNEVMPAQGWTFRGDHHEIYLGDPRKTAPEKLRTVLRQPVRKIA